MEGVVGASQGLKPEEVHGKRRGQISVDVKGGRSSRTLTSVDETEDGTELNLFARGNLKEPMSLSRKTSQVRREVLTSSAGLLEPVGLLSERLRYGPEREAPFTLES